MRIFSYRNKVRLRRTLIALLAAALLLAVAVVSYVVYLGRYMVYTPDGAHLALPGDEDVQTDDAGSDAASVAPDSAGLIVGDPVERPDSGAPSVPDEPSDDDMPAFTGGWYADSASLMDASVVHSALDELLAARDDNAGPVAVMLDLKSEFGNFYYTSSLREAPLATSVDTAAVDALIEHLAALDDVYLIARIPAFRDTAYALSHTDRSLALSSGALWADGSGCYWLDPADADVLSRLTNLCAELSRLGFDEVIFENFSFPNGESIVYEADRLQTVRAAAETIVQTAPIPVSFCFTESDAQYAAAAKGLRICMEAEDGGAIAGLLDAVSGASMNSSDQIMFLSASRDTRFEDYIQLRPALDS